MNTSQSSKMYKVKRPDGQIWNIPEENLKKAISLGGEVVQDQPKVEDVSLLQEAYNEGMRGALSGADFMLNLPENAAYYGTWPLRALIEKFGPEKAHKFVENFFKKPEGTHGLEEMGKKIGLVKELPPAQTYPQKVVRNLANIGGGLLSSGPVAPFRTAARAAGTLLGGTSQAALQPYVEELAPESPILQGAINTGVGLLGTVAGSKAAAKKKPATPFPEKTAAQLEPLGTEKSDILIARSKNLLASDKKAAKDAQRIQQSQWQKIKEKLTPKGKITGRRIADHIIERFKAEKARAKKEYDEGLDAILNGMKNPDAGKFRKVEVYNPKTNKIIIKRQKVKEYQDIDTKNVLDLIKHKLKGADKETAKLLRELKKDILYVKGNPEKLNNLKKTWGTKAFAKEHTPIFEGEAKQAIRKEVLHELTEDLKDQIPGYSDFMEGAGKNIEKREEFFGGIVSDYTKSAEKKPGQLVKKIFEETDPELSYQIKEVVSPVILDKAGKLYLSDVLDEGMRQPLPAGVQQNQQSRFNHVSKQLEKAMPNLEHILPENSLNKAKEVVEDIRISETGMIPGDYAVEVHRKKPITPTLESLKISPAKVGAATAGGVVGLITGGPGGAAIGAPLGLGAEKAAELIQNRLFRNEMMTGLSPMEQVKKKAKEIGKEAAVHVPQQAIIAERLNEKPEIIEEATPKAEAPSGKTFKVRRPDGQIWNIPEKNLDKAISLGGEVVENHILSATGKRGPEKKKIMNISPQGKNPAVVTMEEE